MAQVSPCQTIVAADATEFAALQSYLDGLGYTVGVTAAATRVDNAGTLTIEITYTTWILTV